MQASVRVDEVVQVGLELVLDGHDLLIDFAQAGVAAATVAVVLLQLLLLLPMVKTLLL